MDLGSAGKQHQVYQNPTRNNSASEVATDVKLTFSDLLRKHSFPE